MLCRQEPHPWSANDQGARITTPAVSTRLEARPVKIWPIPDHHRTFAPNRRLWQAPAPYRVPARRRAHPVSAHARVRSRRCPCRHHRSVRKVCRIPQRLESRSVISPTSTRYRSNSPAFPANPVLHHGIPDWLDQKTIQFRSGGLHAPDASPVPVRG